MSKIPYMVQLFWWGGGILANTPSLIVTKILLKTQWIIVNKIQQSALYDRHTLRKNRRFRHLFSQKSALDYRYSLRKNSTVWEFMVKKNTLELNFSIENL